MESVTASVVTCLHGTAVLVRDSITGVANLVMASGHVHASHVIGIALGGLVLVLVLVDWQSDLCILVAGSLSTCDRGRHAWLERRTSGLAEAETLVSEFSSLSNVHTSHLLYLPALDAWNLIRPLGGRHRSPRLQACEQEAVESIHPSTANLTLPTPPTTPGRAHRQLS